MLLLLLWQLIDDDDDDVAINEISNNMKLPIYAVLVGRVSFLHTLIVVSRFSWFFDRWCLFYVVFLFSFLGLKACAQCRLKKENIHKNKNE